MKKKKQPNKNKTKPNKQTKKTPENHYTAEALDETNNDHITVI